MQNYGNFLHVNSFHSMLLHKGIESETSALNLGLVDIIDQNQQGMSERKGQIDVGNSHMSFQIYGRGPRLLLCFHGYGLDKSSFQPLEASIGEHFTLACFDHFFHGESIWNEDEERTLDKKELLNSIQAFCSWLGFERFSLLAFSLGGKVALSLANKFPERIDHVVLLAPDGIKTSFWYSLATYPILFRRLLKRIILKPGLFNFIVSAFRFLGIVDRGILRFAQTQMNTEAKRWRLYKTWVCYKTISEETSSLIHQMIKHEVPIELYLGRYDKIITEKNLHSFIEKIPNLKLITLNAGHNHIIEAYSKYKLHHP